LINGLIKWVLGDTTKNTLEHRILNGISFLLILVCLIFTIHTFFVWGSILQPLFILAWACVFGIVFYASRFLKNKNSSYYFVALLLVLITVAFFLFGGVNGNAIFAFLAL